MSEVAARTAGAAFVSVPVGSEEYKFVEDRLRNAEGGPNGKSRVLAAGVWKKTILSVERIVNPVAWASYHALSKKIAANVRNGGDANERWVVHGTGTTASRIVAASEEGLDARFCTSGMFGTAVYAAEDARYSDNNGYCHALGDGTAELLLVRVAAGAIADLTYGDASRALKKPPAGFDSVRGDVVPGSGFFALMAYRLEQAFPAYLIRFRK